MLDKMITEGADFNTVLKEAQEKGYAEADPTADVEGQDACRKIAIHFLSGIWKIPEF